MGSATATNARRPTPASLLMSLSQKLNVQRRPGILRGVAKVFPFFKLQWNHVRAEYCACLCECVYLLYRYESESSITDFIQCTEAYSCHSRYCFEAGRDPSNYTEERKQLCQVNPHSTFKLFILIMG